MALVFPESYNIQITFCGHLICYLCKSIFDLLFYVISTHNGLFLSLLYFRALESSLCDERPTVLSWIFSSQEKKDCYQQPRVGSVSLTAHNEEDSTVKIKPLYSGRHPLFVRKLIYQCTALPKMVILVCLVSLH